MGANLYSSPALRHRNTCTARDEEIQLPAVGGSWIAIFASRCGQFRRDGEEEKFPFACVWVGEYVSITSSRRHTTIDSIESPRLRDRDIIPSSPFDSRSVLRLSRRQLLPRLTKQEQTWSRPGRRDIPYVLPATPQLSRRERTSISFDWEGDSSTCKSSMIPVKIGKYASQSIGWWHLCTCLSGRRTSPSHEESR